MNILIGENHKITSDKLNIIVNRKVKKYDKKGKDGKPTGEYGWKEISYLPNIERALNFVLNEKISVSDAQSLGEVLMIIREHKKEIKALINGSNALEGE